MAIGYPSCKAFDYGLYGRTGMKIDLKYFTF